MDECTSHTVHQNAPYCKWHVLDTPTSESSVPMCVKCSLLTDRVPCSRYLWSSYLSSVLYRRMAMSALRCWAETLSHRRSRYANYSATIFEIVLQSTIDRSIYHLCNQNSNYMRMVSLTQPIDSESLWKYCCSIENNASVLLCLWWKQDCDYSQFSGYGDNIWLNQKWKFLQWKGNSACNKNQKSRLVRGLIKTLTCIDSRRKAHKTKKHELKISPDIRFHFSSSPLAYVGLLVDNIALHKKHTVRKYSKQNCRL